jgi:hypothetical protein
MSEQLQNLIGLRIDSEVVQDADWLGYWPAIDSDGIIQEILDNDSIPEDAIMVDWEGQPVVVDGSSGFEAILVD